MKITEKDILKSNELTLNQLNRESIGEGKLIQGDTLDTLYKIDDNVVSLGITSPPYNKQGKQKGWLVKNVEYDNSSDAMPEDKYQQNQIDVLEHIYRITKPGGSFFYNHKCRWSGGIMYHPMDWLRQTKWLIRQQIVWDRMIAANIRGWRFWQVEELIFWLYKPNQSILIGDELKSKHAKFTSIWRGIPEKHNSHPAPFPIWLPSRIIMSILDNEKDHVVFDPYSGSGTTIIAAKYFGHKYLGIDISPTYIKMTCDRMNYNTVNDTINIEKEKLLHVVKKSFKQRKGGRR